MRPLPPPARLAAMARRLTALVALSEAPKGALVVRPAPDTRALDLGWIALAQASERLFVFAPEEPLLLLVRLVRERTTGLAAPAQRDVRRAVTRLLDRAGLKTVRIGEVRIALGEDRYWPLSDGSGYDVRDGALRVTIEKPRRGSVVSLAEYRAKRA